MDKAKKKVGPAESLSHAETQANKRRTHVARRQFDQSYLDPYSAKSALVTGAETAWEDDQYWNR